MTVYLRILSYLREYRFRLIVACLCAAGVAGMSGLYAWLVQPVLDEIFIAKDQLLLTVLPLGHSRRGRVEGTLRVWVKPIS